MACNGCANCLPSSALAIRPAELAAGGPLEELRDAYERATERVAEPHADNTKRAYRTAWRQWAAHCAALERDPAPIDPLHLVTYLELRSRELDPNSVRLHLAALATQDVTARMAAGELNPESVRTHAVITRWLKSWARDNPRAPKRKAPSMSRGELERILSCAAERGAYASRHAHVARYARDRCLLLFGIVGAFRAAELAELELGDVMQQPRGLTVNVRKSKTDQHGEGKLKGLMPQGTALRCPVDAWHQWVSVRGDWPGPAFVAIDRSGVLEREALNVDSIRRMVATRAAAAGVRLSSHSMRASFATLAHERGKSMPSIMGQADWKDPKTALGYVRQMDLFNDNPSAGLLDD